MYTFPILLRPTSAERWEKQYKFIRRFIPKGKPLKVLSTDIINRIEQWMNNIPRKILDYQTAEEAFLKELQCFVS